MPLPVVEAHRSGEPPVAVFEQPQIAGGKLRGVIRFGETRRAQELFRDVRSGIVRNLSVGYRIDDTQWKPDGETLVATRWTPTEISIVGAPADPTVGFGRALHPSFGENTMQDELDTPNEATMTRNQRRAAQLERAGEATAREAERSRIAEITGLCRQHHVPRLCSRPPG
jgi:hypothetical protein